MTTQHAEITASSGDPYKIEKLNLILAEEMEDAEKRNTAQIEESAALAFKNSGKMMRSPIKKAHTDRCLAQEVSQTADERSKATKRSRTQSDGKQKDAEPEKEIISVHAENDVINETSTKQNSPRRSYIKKMKKDEEEVLNRCKTIVEKMKLTTKRQTNISMEIKKGLVELEEALDVIQSYRRNWMLAEKQVQTETTRDTDEGQNSQSQMGKQTPTTSQKRLASSPADCNNQSGKKQKGLEPGSDWTTVVSKKARNQTKDGKASAKGGRDQNPIKTPGDKKKIRIRKRETKPRPEALLIKPTQGQTYAGVLQEIKKAAKPEETHTDIKAIRRTRTGDILLEFGNGAKNKENFRETLIGIVGKNGKVVRLEAKATIEIRDLDSLTTTEEVTQAVKKTLKDERDIKVFLTKTNSREQKMAFVEMDETGARQVLKSTHIKIGWINCRIRRAIVVTRCFRCFGYGHRQADCKGKDRKGQDLCIQCGEKGHKKRECKTPPTCYLCKENSAANNHTPGSAGCRVYKQALEEAKERNKQKC